MAKSPSRRRSQRVPPILSTLFLAALATLPAACALESEEISSADEAVRSVNVDKLAAHLELGHPTSQNWVPSTGPNAGFEEMRYTRVVQGESLLSKIYRRTRKAAKTGEVKTQVSHIDIALPGAALFTLDGAAVDASFSFRLGALLRAEKTHTPNETVLVFTNGTIAVDSKGLLYPMPTWPSDIVLGSLRAGFGDIRHLRFGKSEVVDTVVLHLARPYRTRLGQLRSIAKLADRYAEDRDYLFEGGKIEKRRFADLLGQHDTYQYELVVGPYRRHCTLVEETPALLSCDGE